jgi:hypothetical protein
VQADCCKDNFEKFVLVKEIVRCNAENFVVEYKISKDNPTLNFQFTLFYIQLTSSRVFFTVNIIYVLHCLNMVCILVGSNVNRMVRLLRQRRRGKK